MSENRTNWTVTFLIALGSLIVIFPLYMTIMIAVKSPQQMASSVLAWPTVWHWSNFTEAYKMTNFSHAFTNSAIVTVGAVVFTLLTNSLVAYAVSRNMEKRFFKILYYYFISALFVPFPIIMLPIVKEMSNLHLNNQYGLIILYVVYGISFNMFLYVGYLKSLPIELEEAAVMDGASVWGTFWKVIFPLLSPINSTVAILTCIWAWNDFLLPLIILSKPSMATLPLVQYVFQSKFSVNYNYAFASYLMALLPMIVVYLIAQRWIISGVIRGAVKS
ncbi:carbohydrate ABC transporter permease [Paenibacillus alginolyticus]|uniref:Carbohydrate ABC transporter permease n=1 Tax=Paenibacillus alginolyticus TaxID=59839 RepID=A0ABT4GBR6_9BACL|nr:carbohydrate ABC transporter permease [Paenibacillus alginolyticus]MCY9669352.1 carbohydrate ABC transporter permease [Paenibacillus alginolyticus]MCY9693632.1 carbohydrate ABC transporter permease [Paenibacillus alginolyticus]MEC0145639.1 carbohydrate ABC transporter permease [Paenibacillus alginolyticus]